MGDPALHHISAGIAASGNTAEYGEALIALYEYDFDRSIRLAEIAWQKNASHYKAGIILARAYLDRAADELHTGDLDGAEEDFEAAGQVLARLLDSARSSPEIRLLEAQRRLSCISLASKQGRPLGDLLPWAMESTADLQQCDSRLAQPYYFEAWLFIQAAWNAGNQGQDPLPQLNAALEKIQQAIDIKPKKADYWYLAARIWKDISHFRLARGDIDKDAIGQSQAAIQQALQLQPNYAQAFNLHAMIYRQLAYVAMLEGADQQPPLRQALAALEQAHELQPNYFEPYLNMTIILNDLTFYELNYGSDPRDSAQRALEWCERTARQSPGHPYPAVIRSGILQVLAIFELNSGGDGTAVRDYLAATRLAVEKNPNHYQAYMTQSHANEYLARWQMQQGENPEAALRAGLESGRKTVEMNPGNPYSFHALASICLVEVDWRLQQGENPGSALKEADENARRAHQMIPTDIEMTLLLAQVERRQAAARLAQGQDPAPPARSALSRLAEAAGMDPHEPRVPLLQAQCCLLLARGSADPVQKRERAGRAVSLFQEALRRNPFLNREVEPALKQAEAISHPDATPSSTSGS
jgi:hypothetical protein